MIAFILANWKTVLGMAIAFILSYGLHTLDIDRIEANNKATLAAQVKFDLKQCDDNKQITKDVSDAFEKSNADINTQLDNLLREPTKCLLPVAIGRVGHNAKAKSSINGGQNGIRSSFLIRFAGEGEKYRLQVIALQTFIEKVWQENRQ